MVLSLPELPTVCFCYGVGDAKGSSDPYVDAVFPGRDVECCGEFIFECVVVSVNVESICGNQRDCIQEI